MQCVCVSHLHQSEQCAHWMGAHSGHTALHVAMAHWYISLFPVLSVLHFDFFLSVFFFVCVCFGIYYMENTVSVWRTVVSECEIFGILHPMEWALAHISCMRVCVRTFICVWIWFGLMVCRCTGDGQMREEEIECRREWAIAMETMVRNKSGQQKVKINTTEGGGER